MLGVRGPGVRLEKAVKNEEDTLTPQAVYPLSRVRRVRKNTGVHRTPDFFATFRGKESKGAIG